MAHQNTGNMYAAEYGHKGKLPTSQDGRNMLPLAISPPALDALPPVSPRGQSWGPCSS